MIERGGKQYVNVQNIRSNIVSIGRFSMEYQSQHVLPLLTGTANRLINVNWRTLFADVKPQVEDIVSGIIKSFIKPICDGIPMKDFYEHNAVENECAS